MHLPPVLQISTVRGTCQNMRPVKAKRDNTIHASGLRNGVPSYAEWRTLVRKHRQCRHRNEFELRMHNHRHLRLQSQVLRCRTSDAGCSTLTRQHLGNRHVSVACEQHLRRSLWASAQGCCWNSPARVQLPRRSFFLDISSWSL